jgi:predicted TIM-barrel fold metal-dependent hydrolase
MSLLRVIRKREFGMKRVLENTAGTIDCHTHSGGFVLQHLQKCYYPTALSSASLYHVIQGQVDYAIVFPFPSAIFFKNSIHAKYALSPSGMDDFPFHLENKYLLEEISYFDIKSFLPFLCFSLHDKVKEQASFIRKCCEQYYVYGLKYHPMFEQIDPIQIDRLGQDIIAVAQDFHLPIIIHSGREKPSLPSSILVLAKRLSTITFSVAHAGWFSQSFIQQLIDDTPSNVFFDVSPISVLFKSILERINNGTEKPCTRLDYTSQKNFIETILAIDEIKDKVLFGTDTPFNNATLRFDTINKNGQLLDVYSRDISFLRSLNSTSVEKIAVINPRSFLFGEKT